MQASSRDDSPVSAITARGFLLAVRGWIEGRYRGDGAPPLSNERFPVSTVVLVVALTLLTIADGVMTLLLLDRHFEEANPAMKLLLHYGPSAFILGKYALTVLGLPILLIFRRRTVFVPGLRVGHILPAIVAMYVVLLLYQVGMLMNS